MGEKRVIRLVFSIKNIAEHVGDRTGSRCIFCKQYWQSFSGSGVLLDGAIAELSRFWHRSEEAMQQVSVQRLIACTSSRHTSLWWETRER